MRGFRILVLCLFPTTVLSEPIAYECSYELSVGANISRSLGVQTEQRSETEFIIRFIAEPKEGSAQMMGNNGAAKVIAVWGEGKVTFIEVTLNGTVQTTVVYGLGLGDKATAHSRTSGGEGYEMPSQYYGFCKVS